MDTTKDKDEVLTPDDVEREFKVDKDTQKYWRWLSTRGRSSFPFFKISKLVRYRRSELERWIVAQNRQGAYQTSATKN